jgi:hypothetical protein
MLSIVIFKDNNMFDSIAGMLLLLFFVWNGFQAISVDMFEYTARWYIQMGLSGIGGLALVFPAASDLLAKISRSGFYKEQKDDNTTSVDDSHCSTIDYEHLVHLRSVMIDKGHIEGARLVSQINTILFNEPIGEAEKLLPVQISDEEVVR